MGLSTPPLTRGFCPPGTGEICRRPTDQREVIKGGVKTIEGRGEVLFFAQRFNIFPQFLVERMLGEGVLVT